MIPPKAPEKPKILNAINAKKKKNQDALMKIEEYKKAMEEYEREMKDYNKINNYVKEHVNQEVEKNAIIMVGSEL